MTARRFPPPWQVEQILGGFKVLDASGQALVYVYARETREEANPSIEGVDLSCTWRLNSTMRSARQERRGHPMRASAHQAR